MVMLSICDNATNINEPLPDDEPVEGEDVEEDIVREIKGDQKLSLREINELKLRISDNSTEIGDDDAEDLLWYLDYKNEDEGGAVVYKDNNDTSNLGLLDDNKDGTLDKFEKMNNQTMSFEDFVTKIPNFHKYYYCIGRLVENCMLKSDDCEKIA